MKISAIEKDDLAAVLSLNTGAVPHVNQITADQLQWFIEHSAVAVTAKIDGDLGGFMIGLRPGTTYASLNYRWFCDKYEYFAYVDRIVVSSWARRRGVAQALYKNFEASEADAPFMTCEVNTRPANEGSMQFHKSMGFREVGRQATEGGTKEVAFLERTIEQR